MHALNRAVAVEEDPAATTVSDLPSPETAIAAPEEIDKLKGAMNQIGARIGELSVNIADTSGVVGDVSKALSRHAEDFHVLTGDIELISTSSQTVAEASRGAIEAAQSTRIGLAETTESMSGIMVSAVDDLKSMANSAGEVTRVLDEISQQIREIHSFSEAIRGIATQTQLLAVNAGIMAAHAGEAGRGFAVVAEAVKQLADKTGTVSRDMVARLEAMRGVVTDLQARNSENETVAKAAYQRSTQIDAELEKFNGFGRTVEGMIGDIERITAPVENTTQICTRVLARVSELDHEIVGSSTQLTNASHRIDKLVGFSEDVIGLVAASGIETEDTPLIRRCIEAAQEVGALFENAIDAGMCSLGDLFDETYVPVPNTDPQQVITRFTKLTDTLMPEIQEGMLDFDPRVTFCAAVDRNGYLPTHNKVYSHPQSDDPVWNAANCRHRRIFNDRTGLAAGRNTRPFLLQTYRRDMGGGKFALMKDLSAPIEVKGRHWGGLRIGFKISV